MESVKNDVSPEEKSTRRKGGVVPIPSFTANDIFGASFSRNHDVNSGSMSGSTQRSRHGS